MRMLPALAATGAIALVLTGCASTAGGTDAGSAGDRLEIVVSTTQLADVTRELVGDAAEVTSLLRPGASAHAYDPGPAELGALASADLLVVNGVGLEEWLDDTIAASGFAGTLVDTSVGLDLIAAGEAPLEGDADASAQDRLAFDPHVWTDPANVVLQAEVIVDAISTADPDAGIEASATEYIGQLRDLDEWMRGSFEQVPVEQRLLVTAHDTFGYLERAFDVRLVGTVMPSLDDDAEPSAAYIEALVAEIRESGTPVIFSENSIDPQLAATIAREAGVELRQGEDALAADALGLEGSGTATYIAAQIHNTTAMVTAWGAEPLAVPESLS